MSENMNYTVAFIGDSPKITSGFAQVTKKMAFGLYEAGYDVRFFGFLDDQPDIKGELPFPFQWTAALDPMGHQTASNWLRTVRPDVLVLVADPGTLAGYMNSLLEFQQFPFEEGFNVFPIITYSPVEALPIQLHMGKAWFDVMSTAGKPLFYSKDVYEVVKMTFPEIEGDWFNHGTDHFPYEAYSAERRNKLRYLAGWEDKFVVGSVGVNKRTKGFDTLIYTARYLKDIGAEDNFLFYLHTDPARPTMNGYNLNEIVLDYDVKDMIVFKPDAKINISGIPRLSDDLDWKVAERPAMKADRRELFKKFGFVDRLNMLDFYADTSQAEGWGLPIFEAMACGVPALTIDDKFVRASILKGGPHFIEPLDERVWTTWHTGGRLPVVDPKDVAEALIKYKNDELARMELALRGMALARSYTWEPGIKKFINIVGEVIDGWKKIYT